jgi:carboxyl-terminal processing protease
MMPAANNGAGMNVGFPDVCLTPPPPPVGPIPVPYPNNAQNAMSAVFSPNIFTGFMPALNMASTKPMTLGDNGGVLHPLFMQMGGQTMGNPIVFINCIPAKNLLVPTYGNAFNNPVGATLVPSVTVTMYTDAGQQDAKSATVDADVQRALLRAVEGPAVAASWRDDGVVCVRIRRIVSDLCRQVFNALRGREVRGVVMDLRGNGGGDTRAALELADELLPQLTLATIVEQGEEERIESRLPQSYHWPLAVVVDAQTASAAEILAGVLQHHGRARIFGCTTLGKASVQQVCQANDGAGYRYQTVAEIRLADGSALHDAGVTPDVSPATDAVEAAARALTTQQPHRLLESC